MSKDYSKPYDYYDFEQFQRTPTGWKAKYKGIWYGSDPAGKVQSIPEYILHENAEETLEIIKSKEK